MQIERVVINKSIVEGTIRHEGKKGSKYIYIRLEASWSDKKVLTIVTIFRQLPITDHVQQ